MSSPKPQELILPKSIPDAWTSGSSPDTVTSTFVWEPVTTGVSLRTESCGFGWHFEITIDLGPSRNFNWMASFVASFCFTPPTGSASGVMRTGLTVGCTAAIMFNPTDTPSHSVNLGFCSPSLITGNRVRDRIGTFSASLEGMERVTFTFRVSFPGGFPFKDLTSSAVLTDRAKDALTRTIESGEFVDVKFYLFTAVTPNGTVCRPQPMYGSRTVLHQVSHFLDNLILGDDFSESQIVDLDGEWEVERFVDDYDYREDSDLEELEEEEPVAQSHVDVQELTTPQTATTRRTGSICQPKNIAYKTFKGLLKYLYTQEITLAPLKSTRSAGKGKGTASDLSSPKSMYRLADMIDLPALKQTCLDALRQRLTVDNIYGELFSKFTSLHPEIRKAELEFALDHWRESEAQRSIHIAKCISGDYPDATLALTCLLARLGPSGAIQLPSCIPSSSVGLFEPSANWSPRAPDREWSPASPQSACPEPKPVIPSEPATPKPLAASPQLASSPIPVATQASSSDHHKEKASTSGSYKKGLKLRKSNKKCSITYRSSTDYKWNPTSL